MRNLLGRGYDVKGIDISKEALDNFMKDLAGKKIVSLASVDKMPFSDKAFDLVFCSDVLEHIPIFDTKDSIYELIRVTKRYLVLTINLDHPYEYHPTILSRDTWENLLIESGKLKHLAELQRMMQEECRTNYKEYEFFVFEKI